MKNKIDFDKACNMAWDHVWDHVSAMVWINARNKMWTQVASSLKNQLIEDTTNE